MNIKEKCLFIATCGNLGSMRFGGMLSSLLGIPATFGMKALYWLDPSLAIIAAILFIFVVLVIIHVALNTIAQQDASAIVIDRIVGLAMAFIFVPITINPVKFMLVGYLLFHLLHYATRNNNWDHIISVSSLPTLLSVATPSILGAVGVQLFFRLMLWIVR